MGGMLQQHGMKEGQSPDTFQAETAKIQLPQTQDVIGGAIAKPPNEYQEGFFQNLSDYLSKQRGGA